jgi:hypothetical protein
MTSGRCDVSLPKAGNNLHRVAFRFAATLLTLLDRVALGAIEKTRFNPCAPNRTMRHQIHLVTRLTNLCQVTC